MRENRSYGSVGVRGGNEPLYPDNQEPVIGGLYLSYTVYPQLSHSALRFA